MSETVNLPTLISRLAAECKCDPATSRRFLHDFFAQIETALCAGEPVTVKGIGEFVPSGDPSNPVLYKPDDELAAAANEPFAAFEAVELSDGVTEADLEAAVSVPEHETAAQQGANEPETAETAPEAEPEPEPMIETEPVALADESPAQPESSDEPAEPAAPETPAPRVEQPRTEEPAEKTEEVPEEYAAEPEPVIYTDAHQRQNRGMWILLGALTGLILGLVAGFFAGKAVGRYEYDESDYILDTDTVPLFPMTAEASPDTAKAVPAETAAPDTTPASAPETAQPAPTPAAPTREPEPVYDTITSSRFLTTLAKDHYGVKSYWIFIYEANPGLGNPNSIRPGTRLLIPAKESFAEPTKAETDAKAQRLLNALSRKYKL